MFAFVGNCAVLRSADTLLYPLWSNKTTQTKASDHFRWSHGDCIVDRCPLTSRFKRVKEGNASGNSGLALTSPGCTVLLCFSPHCRVQLLARQPLFTFGPCKTKTGHSRYGWVWRKAYFTIEDFRKEDTKSFIEKGKERGREMFGV